MIKGELFRKHMITIDRMHRMRVNVPGHLTQFQSSDQPSTSSSSAVTHSRPHSAVHTSDDPMSTEWMELPSREEYASSAQQEEAVPGQVGEDLDIEDITAAPAVPLSDIGSVEDSEGDIQMDEVIDVQASQEEGLLLQAARDLIGGSEPRLFSPSPSPDAG